MANTREIKLRIRGVEGTKKITKAMKLIAASKLKKAREMHERTLPFFKHIQVVMSEVMKSTPEMQLVYFDKRKNKPNRKKAYVVISSDSGLNGGYNSNVIKEAVKIIDKENSVVFPIGNVVKNYMVKNGYNVSTDLGINSYSVTTITAADIAKHLLKMFKRGDIDELELIYTEMESAMSFVPQSIKLLPLELKDFEDGEVKQNLEFEPSPEVVFERLTRQYLKGILYGGMVESFVSEHFARMNAMDAATSNAEKVSKKLTLDYNRARQQAITQEISEIIGGAMNAN
ncbi:MAG: ATP synthase F1 subunit gamma [Bacilli bacterium]|nr:ATP synthase F1 subunit gamma [Bacilli bacterium]